MKKIHPWRKWQNRQQEDKSLKDWCAFIKQPRRRINENLENIQRVEQG
jgi:hypothetical protein